MRRKIPEPWAVGYAAPIVIRRYLQAWQAKPRPTSRRKRRAALQQQYEAIKHQGARGDDDEAGKLSLQSVGQRNGMSVKTVQRYLWLNDLVPELKEVTVTSPC